MWYLKPLEEPSNILLQYYVILFAPMVPSNDHPSSLRICGRLELPLSSSFPIAPQFLMMQQIIDDVVLSFLAIVW